MVLRNRRVMTSLLMSLLLSSVFGIVFMANASQASAATCIYPHYSYYPGDAGVSHVRYGRADFTFTICTTAPSTWTATARVTANGTASNSGVSLSDAAVPVTSGGSYYRFYDGKFFAKACLLPLKSTCYSSGDYHIKFYAYTDAGKPHMMVISTSTPGKIWALFTTP
jgi:hypothetical protein